MSMIKCPRCGKELPEGVTVCDCENTQAPTTNDTPFVVPVMIDAPIESSISAEQALSTGTGDEEYLEAIKDCTIINILALLLFVGGIASLLVINEWMSAVMFLVGEIFVLMPNSRVQKLCKGKNPSADKKAQQAAVKETIKRLKSKDKNFNFSCIIAIVCLVSIFVSFIVPSPLIKKKQNTNEMAYVYNGDGETIAQADQNAVDQNVVDQDDEPVSDNSGSDIIDGYPVDIIVGGYDYLSSADYNTGSKVSQSYPCVSYLYFEPDGICHITIKTNSSGGIELCDATWEFVETEDDMRKYLLTTDTDVTLYVFYYEAEDGCVMFAEQAINLYERVSGDAQENLSGITTSSVYDIENKSYKFAYKYDPETGEKITTIPYPYVDSLLFCVGNKLVTYLKTSPTSSNPYGLNMFFGEWRYVKTENGNYYYRIDLEDDTVWNVKYLVDEDMCVMVHNDGSVFYFEFSAEY